MTRKEFIDYIAPVIVADSNKRNLLPSPRIAQAIKESQSGTSELAENAKNLFGLKDNNQWGGKIYNKVTGEYYSGSYTRVTANFQAYDTWEESVYWQGWYLENRKFSPNSKSLVYGALKGVRDYKEFCRLLKSCGYATSPRYGEELITLIESENLTRFDTMDVPEPTTPDTDTPEVTVPVKKMALTVGHSKLKSGSYTSADGRKYGGVLEYQYNKELAPLVQQWVIKGGWACDLIICPEGQFTASKQESSYKLNLVNDASKDYDLVCELHLNASGSHTATGEEVLYISESGKRYAEAVSAKLATIIKRHGSGIVHRDNLYMLTKTKPVSIMLETFFCDNKNDCAVMADKNKIAKLIAEGIVGHDINDIPVEKPAEPEKPAEKPTEPETPEYPKPTVPAEELPAKPKPEEPEKPADPEPAKIICWIQVGAFGVRENADKRVAALKKNGISAFVKVVGGLNVVQAGAFSTIEAAEKHQRLIESKGFKTILQMNK